MKKDRLIERRKLDNGHYAMFMLGWSFGCLTIIAMLAIEVFL